MRDINVGFLSLYPSQGRTPNWHALLIKSDPAYHFQCIFVEMEDHKHHRLCAYSFFSLFATQQTFDVPIYCHCGFGDQTGAYFALHCYWPRRYSSSHNTKGIKGTCSKIAFFSYLAFAVLEKSLKNHFFSDYFQNREFLAVFETFLKTASTG